MDGLHICYSAYIHTCTLYKYLLILYFAREWTGDLKKLPNIKMRKVSNKDLDKKSEGGEKDEAEDDHEEDEDEDDLDDELLDELLD